MSLCDVSQDAGITCIFEFPGPFDTSAQPTANARTGQGLSVVSTVGGGRQRADAHELITGMACKLPSAPSLLHLRVSVCVVRTRTSVVVECIHRWFCVTCAFRASNPGTLALQPAFASPRHDRGSCTRSFECPLCRSHPWHAQRGALLAPLLTSPHLLPCGFLAWVCSEKVCA